MSWCIVIFTVLLTGNFFGDHVHGNEVAKESSFQITALRDVLLKVSDMKLTEAELAKRFVCRINVSEIHQLNENVLWEALLLMDKDIKTCPLKNESALIEQLVKIWINFGNPTINNLLDKVDNTIHLILKSVDITELNNPKEHILYLLLSNIKSYYETNPKGSIFKMLGGLLCTIEKIDLGNLSEKTLNNLTKPGKCSQQQQKVILERFVNMFSISQWLYPQYILRFYETGIFKMIQKLLDVMDKEVVMIAGVVGSIEQSGLLEWTVVDFGHRFLCGLIPFNINQIEENIKNTIINILNKPTCSKDDVTKWISSSVNQLKTLLFTEKEFNININVSAELKIDDRFINETVTIIDYMKKVKDLDTLVELILKSLPREVIKQLEIIACSIDIKDIQNRNVDKLITTVTKFLSPNNCTTPTPKDWMKELLTYQLKFQYDMIMQLGELFGNNNGGANKINIKDIQKEIEKLINLIMTSEMKLANTIVKWLTDLPKNGYIINIPTLVRHLICFIEKIDFSSIETLITSFGEFDQCPPAESTNMTQRFFKRLDDLKLGEVKEFLIELGVVNGKFNVTSMKNFLRKVINGTNDYLVKIWSMIPREIKELSIAKAFAVVRKEITVLEKYVMCMVKAIAWPIFGQPDAVDIFECFNKIEPVKPKPGNGKRPGGKLEDRYKVGVDFPFEIEKNTNPEVLLKKLLTFYREAKTEKEKRILNFVTKEVLDYLLDNPTKLNEVLSTNRNKILQLANKGNQVGQIMSRMKMDSESLAMVKQLATPQEAKILLKKAMTDIKIDTASAKKDFIQKIPNAVLMKSGTQLIDNLLTEETKKVFIESFKRKKKPETSQEMEDNEEEEDEEEEEEEGEALAKLSLVDKLMAKSPDNDTMALMMDTSLVSVIPINILKKLPTKDVCSMKAETTELKEDQIEYFIDSCPDDVERFAKTNANGLGKLATKVTKTIVNRLTLKELINLSSEACKYEKEIDIDLEEVFKDRYITEKLNPMKNGSSMSCVLKQVKTELPWKQPQAIKICQILGSSILKKIPPKRAEFFKTKCMDLLEKKNITFVDMWSLNAFLTKDDIKNLEPAIILQGAIVLERYVWNMATFNEIGKRISELPGFKQRSTLTTDQVAQAGIFIAALDDAETIPKASVMETFKSLAKSVRLLQKKKIQCLRKGKDTNECNVMDNAIAKIVQILIKEQPSTNGRRKRSTIDSCQCSNIVNLGVAGVQIPSKQMTKMICSTDFDKCIEGLSQITDWNQSHREVFQKKAIEVWGQPNVWNSSHLAIASAIVPSLSTDQIKTLPLDSMDTTFYLGKQNNWKSEQVLAETFLLFLKNVKNNTISSITSFDLQALGNIGCGISVDHIRLIPNWSYINAASQIGNLEICSKDQYTAWAAKALAVYGTNVNEWGSAEIASIGSVISGFSVKDLQKLNEKQIAAISLRTIPKIIPEKLASLHPTQIGYLTTSQVMAVTTQQKAEMTEEQKNILKKQDLTYEPTDNGGKTIEGSCLLKWSILLISLDVLTTFLSAF